ncbi:NUDIX hydrolase [Dechloromonas sp. ZY10]|uniref:NUDIX domain-containing protein n=1 Tax=Dechloromonas aquae TaxID=2664436 RepID=UPI00352951A4
MKNCKSNEHLLERTLASTQVFRGAFLNVVRDTVELPNGNKTTREYFRHPGAVVIIPLLPSGKMLFERQYRHPLGRVFIELPAGKIDPGEGIELTAQRELREETGYAAGVLTHLGVMHPCIGYSDERIEIFRAEQLVKAGGQTLDHNEFIELIELTPEEAKQAVFSGSITDAKTIAALFWLEKETQ